MQAKRKRTVLGSDERLCRVCKVKTLHQIEFSGPAKRRFGRGDADYVDLVDRKWAHCTQCGYRFAEPTGDSES